jgi:glutamine amidotransferase
VNSLSSKVTVVVDYGCGNPASIANMLKKIGHGAIVSDRPEDILAADRLIFPGVGSFDYGARRLRELGLADALERRVLRDRIPILGICVGLQLFCRGSEEGDQPGLGWIDADCVRFDASRMTAGEKIPHMGWSDVTPGNDQALFAGFEETPRFYFVHSYHLKCDSDAIIAGVARHGYDFTAAIAHGNIVGVQFHPEKSHHFGMGLLGRFMQGADAGE